MEYGSENRPWVRGLSRLPPAGTTGSVLVLVIVISYCTLHWFTSCCCVWGARRGCRGSSSHCAPASSTEGCPHPPSPPYSTIMLNIFQTAVYSEGDTTLRFFSDVDIFKKPMIRNFIIILYLSYLFSFIALT